MHLSDNIHLHEQTKVQDLIVENQRVIGITAQNKDKQLQQFYADNIIVAGGAWSAQLLNKYQSVPKIAPVKGQMIVFKAPENLVQHIILSKGRYLISEKPTIDYFLFLCENNAVELNELITQCKEVDSILAAYEFSTEELPSVENIAFD